MKHDDACKLYRIPMEDQENISRRRCSKLPLPHSAKTAIMFSTASRDRH